MAIRTDAMAAAAEQEYPVILSRNTLMNAAIYYHPEGYTTGGPRLMGRQAAGESFLRGFFTHSRAGEFYAQVEDDGHARHFATVARKNGRNERVFSITADRLRELKKVGTVYHPGPGIGDSAWQRRFFGDDAWSLCGITHTTASARAMDSLVNLPVAPVQPWDALICTSTAVRDNVVRVLETQKRYLQERLGVSRFVLPQLPVIPLGINTRDFTPSAERRAKWRRQHNIADNSVAILFLGRLAFHGKAHPLAMYQALEKAVAFLPKPTEVVLIACGWYANDFMARADAEAAACACPNVRLLVLDGRDGENREAAWAAADIFCSLSDNIQETFGLTPIEAMAAGLPLVVSDWDGYRDTVRDGIDGFRIPTLMPAGGVGEDLAMRHALGIDTYDVYCGNTCMMVAVDVEATAQAFVRLISSAELRTKMGEAGLRRARDVYDWAAIIPRYEDLWQQQAAIRRAQALPGRDRMWPARMDPFAAFAAYPTVSLAPQTRLVLVDKDRDSARERLAGYRRLAMVSFANSILPSETDLARILAAAEIHPKKAEELVAAISPGRSRTLAYRGLSWLVKLNILKMVP
jgi:glycosyltransferase involved in cell wall biosynthesis